MPNVNDLKSSKFLTKNDVEPDVLVTIKSYEEMNVALESQAPEMKWTLSFEELGKPLVLNFTNGQLLEAITGSGDFGDWVNKQVVLYNDKTVSFAGKITGGIRVRARKDNPAPPDEQVGYPKPGSGVPNPDYNPDYVPPKDEVPF